MPYGQYSAQTEVYYDIYGLISGTWTLLGSGATSLYGESSTPGYITIYGQDVITVHTDGTITNFRINNVSGGSNAAVTGATADWTSSTNSGDRTATPNGEKVVATMRPN